MAGAKEEGGTNGHFFYFHLVFGVDYRIPPILLRCLLFVFTFESSRERRKRLSFLYRLNCPRVVAMDVPEPEQSPFTAVTAHTSKISRVRIPASPVTSRSQRLYL